MSTAVVIGGTGQIGTAVCRAFVSAGFEVTAAHRGTVPLPDAIDVREAVVDRDDTAALHAVLAGADVVIDTVPYHAGHADQLIALGESIGAIVAVSTGTVYRGARSDFDVATGDADYPEFPVPITEDCPTITADRDTYGARKAQMERRLLAEAPVPVSILRPAAVHGPGSPKLREFYFMKRVIDGRRAVVLARGGTNRFSTSSTLNIAALALACVQSPGTRVLNAVDEENLSVAQIAETVGAVMGRPLDVHTFPGPPVGDLGASPWDGPLPFVCSMDLARAEVGYRPAVDYAASLAVDLEWLTGALERAPWQELFPSVVARYGETGWFPYDAEDRWLAAEAGR